MDPRATASLESTNSDLPRLEHQTPPPPHRELDNIPAKIQGDAELNARINITASSRAVLVPRGGESSATFALATSGLLNPRSVVPVCFRHRRASCTNLRRVTGQRLERRDRTRPISPRTIHLRFGPYPTRCCKTSTRPTAISPAPPTAIQHAACRH